MRADGRKINTKTCYAQILQKLRLPNLNGQFIRGMGARQDADTVRKVGRVQMGQIGEHAHPHEHDDVLGAADHPNVAAVRVTRTELGAHEWDATGNSEGRHSGGVINSVPLPSDNASIAENRPENVALYFYIRVD